MIIDAGQKEYGAQQCLECGLLYDKTDPEDHVLHQEHHNRVIKALTYKVRYSSMNLCYFYY